MEELAAEEVAGEPVSPETESETTSETWLKRHQMLALVGCLALLAALIVVGILLSSGSGKSGYPAPVTTNAQKIGAPNTGSTPTGASLTHNTTRASTPTGTAGGQSTGLTVNATSSTSQPSGSTTATEAIVPDSGDVGCPVMVPGVYNQQLPLTASHARQVLIDLLSQRAHGLDEDIPYCLQLAWGMTSQVLFSGELAGTKIPYTQPMPRDLSVKATQTFTGGAIKYTTHGHTWQATVDNLLGNQWSLKHLYDNTAHLQWTF